MTVAASVGRGVVVVVAASSQQLVAAVAQPSPEQLHQHSQHWPWCSEEDNNSYNNNISNNNMRAGLSLGLLLPLVVQWVAG